MANLLVCFGGAGMVGKVLVGGGKRRRSVLVRKRRVCGASDLHWGTVKLAREWGRSG
jgi:hypothetical protein